MGSSGGNDTSRRRGHADEKATGRASNPADAGGRWDDRPFADPIRDPTMRERAVIVLSRIAGADALAAREPDQARGAGLVAAVAALRMAVTWAASEDDYGFKLNFLRGQREVAAPLRRDRFAPLVEVALEAEADQRRLDGIGLAGPGHRFAMRQAPIRSVPIEAPASAKSRNLAAWRLDVGFDGTLQLARVLLRDMGDVARRGLPTQGARRSLADVAFALILGTAASADDADLRVRLLGILHDSQPDGDPSREVIRAGMALERNRWGGAVAGRA